MLREQTSYPHLEESLVVNMVEPAVEDVKFAVLEVSAASSLAASDMIYHQTMLLCL